MVLQGILHMRIHNWQLAEQNAESDENHDNHDFECCTSVVKTPCKAL